MAVQRKVVNISKHVQTQLSEIFNKRVPYSLTADESTDINSIMQM